MQRPSLPGVTPSAPDDTGAPDPELAAALRSGDGVRIETLLPAVRLLVPVVAVPDAGEASMAVPHLVNADGLRALLAFSGLAALQAWQPDARPVPMPGARVVAAALAEGYDGLVVDVAGPAPATLTREALLRLEVPPTETVPRPPGDC